VRFTPQDEEFRAEVRDWLDASQRNIITSRALRLPRS
jgi:hypothetical protein